MHVKYRISTIIDHARPWLTLLTCLLTLQSHSVSVFPTIPKSHPQSAVHLHNRASNEGSQRFYYHGESFSIVSVKSENASRRFQLGEGPSTSP